MIAPKILPGLWQSDEMTVANLKAYFAGGRVVKLAREGYEEPITIPKSDAQVVGASGPRCREGGDALAYQRSDHPVDRKISRRRS